MISREQDFIVSVYAILSGNAGFQRNENIFFTNVRSKQLKVFLVANIIIFTKK